MKIRSRQCSRCHGDLHLSYQRPAVWICLQCGHRQDQPTSEQQPAWQRFLDQLEELTRV